AAAPAGGGHARPASTRRARARSRGRARAVSQRHERGCLCARAAGRTRSTGTRTFRTADHLARLNERRFMLTSGQTLSLTIDKPAAGGRMIARVEGQVVLVSGAIPGERVRARIERIAKGVAFAGTLSIGEPSPDRREAFADPHCGGNLFGHIAYPRQLEIK